MWDAKGCGVKGYKAKTLGPKIRPSEKPYYLLPYKLWSQGSSIPLWMDGYSGQGFLPCSLLHRILWSSTSKETPPPQLVVHYSLSLTAYKAASGRGGGFPSMWDSKGCGVKGYKAKTLDPKIRPSEEPIVVLWNVLKLIIILLSWIKNFIAINSFFDFELRLF